ncbi:hypothetical protein [Agarivorans sp.]|uniref:hypothetical protein n=1 Tax=Agarivorans sp. TaxID=1872412 RepID=UPI003CFCB865
MKFIAVALSVISFPLFAYNSYLVADQPTEYIDANAQINYRYHHSSNGNTPAGIRGLVGILDHYAMLQMTCSNEGKVTIKHNLLNSHLQQVYVDNHPLLSPLGNSQVLNASSQQIEQLRRGKYLHFSQPPITLGNITLNQKIISLRGFAETYQRMQSLCSDSTGT